MASPRYGRLIAFAVLLVACAIYLAPAGNLSHVEGYSHFIETLSVLFPDFAGADPLWPLNFEYFYLSRPAAALAVRANADLWGYYPGFRATSGLPVRHALTSRPD